MIDNKRILKEVKFGLTPPLSVCGPTEMDLINNTDLEDFLKSQSAYVPDDVKIFKDSILKSLQMLVTSWAIELGRKKGLKRGDYENGGNIQLSLFGSQRLQVNAIDADIDVLLVAPEFISRDDFFSSLCILFQNNPDITEVFPLAEAYTPVIKFKMQQQAVDMIFVSLSCYRLPLKIDLLNNIYLNGLDEQGVRSLNGCRVAEMILNLVPSVSTFCSTLRAIKYWAKVRGIYSNAQGFLGGINYAILVAFVCQKYINACPSTLVQKFFMLYSVWKWPLPVSLARIETKDTDTRYCRHLKPWNAKLNPRDHMPIITPAFPAMNSAYNVAIPQRRRIEEEIARADRICSKFTGGGSSINSSIWSELFTPVCREYFRKYPRYIQLNVISADKSQHRVWLGWCESRIRLLAIALDQRYLTVHPLALSFHQPPNIDTSSGNNNNNNNNNSDLVQRTSFFVGLSFVDGLKSLDATHCIADFLNNLVDWEGWRAGMDIEVFCLEKSELPPFVYLGSEVSEGDSNVEVEGPVSPSVLEYPPLLDNEEEEEDMGNSGEGDDRGDKADSDELASAGTCDDEKETLGEGNGYASGGESESCNAPWTPRSNVSDVESASYRESQWDENEGDEEGSLLEQAEGDALEVVMTTDMEVLLPHGRVFSSLGVNEITKEAEKAERAGRGVRKEGGECTKRQREEEGSEDGCSVTSNKHHKKWR